MEEKHTFQHVRVCVCLGGGGGGGEDQHFSALSPKKLSVFLFA